MCYISNTLLPTLPTTLNLHLYRIPCSIDYLVNKLTVHYLKPSAHKLNYTVNLLPYNDVKRKPCEQGLITKECIQIAMHKNYFKV